MVTLDSCVVSNVGMSQPTSLRAALPWCSTPPHRRVVSNIGVGQPTPLRAALTPSLVVMCRRTSALASPRPCRLPSHSIRPSSLSCGVERWRWAATSFTSPRVVRTSTSGSPRRCGMPCRSVRPPSSSCHVGPLH